jgi:hypothetical protein
LFQREGSNDESTNLIAQIWRRIWNKEWHVNHVNRQFPVDGNRAHYRFDRQIWFLILAFQESVLWGIGCMCVPLVWLIYLIQHWDEAKRPFFVQLSALAPYFLAIMLGGGSA